jgi:hypothetical protein
MRRVTRCRLKLDFSLELDFGVLAKRYYIANY